MKEGPTKKLLMIAPLPPPVHGSAMMTQYIKDSKIINRDVQLDWVNLSTSRSMAEIGKRNPIKILRFLRSYFDTFRKLLFHRYDACYLAITCHGNGFLKDAPFALMCKLFGRRIIIHQHNKGMSEDVGKPLYRLLFKAVYRNAKVILLSERLYPDISEIVDHSQVVICPNGIPEVPRFPHRENEIPHILFLSNLISSKGVFILLDACKIIKERGYRFICSFVGGETSEVSRERFDAEATNRGLYEKVDSESKYVSYLGRKYGDDKNAIMSRCDIFTFPTYYPNECFPVVILEAMQQAKAIITTNEGGIPDIIPDGKCGLIIDNNSPESLADKIITLIENPHLRKDLGIASCDRFKRFYTIEKFEETILSILTEDGR